jgi:hypothetical protein
MGMKATRLRATSPNGRGASRQQRPRCRRVPHPRPRHGAFAQHSAIRWADFPSDLPLLGSSAPVLVVTSFPESPLRSADSVIVVRGSGGVRKRSLGRTCSNEARGLRRFRAGGCALPADSHRRDGDRRAAARSRGRLLGAASVVQTGHQRFRRGCSSFQRFILNRGTAEWGIGPRARCGRMWLDADVVVDVQRRDGIAS